MDGLPWLFMKARRSLDWVDVNLPRRITDLINRKSNWRPSCSWWPRSVKTLRRGTQYGATQARLFGGTDNSTGEWYLPSSGELDLICKFFSNTWRDIYGNYNGCAGNAITGSNGLGGFSSGSYMGSDFIQGSGSGSGGYSLYGCKGWGYYLGSVDFSTGCQPSMFDTDLGLVRPIRAFAS